MLEARLENSFWVYFKFEGEREDEECAFRKGLITSFHFLKAHEYVPPLLVID